MRARNILVLLFVAVFVSASEDADAKSPDYDMFIYGIARRLYHYQKSDEGKYKDYKSNTIALAGHIDLDGFTQIELDIDCKWPNRNLSPSVKTALLRNESLAKIQEFARAYPEDVIIIMALTALNQKIYLYGTKKQTEYETAVGELTGDQRRIFIELSQQAYQLQFGDMESDKKKLSEDGYTCNEYKKLTCMAGMATPCYKEKLMRIFCKDEEMRCSPQYNSNYTFSPPLTPMSQKLESCLPVKFDQETRCKENPLFNVRTLFEQLTPENKEKYYFYEYYKLVDLPRPNIKEGEKCPSKDLTYKPMTTTTSSPIDGKAEDKCSGD